MIRFKARIVSLGNHQRPGIDFQATFTSVAKMPPFRLLITLAAKLGVDIYGGNINTVYLNASLSIK